MYLFVFVYVLSSSSLGAGNMQDIRPRGRLPGETYPTNTDMGQVRTHSLKIYGGMRWNTIGAPQWPNR